MTTPSIVQVTAAQTPKGSILLSTTVTAGNTLVLMMGQRNSSSATTYTASDDVNGTWTNILQQTHAVNGRTSFGAYFLNSAGGNITVTCGSEDSVNDENWVVYEIANGGTVDTDLHGEDQPNESSHDLYTGGVAVPADSIIFGLYAADANTTVAATGYTDQSGDNEIFNGYKITASSIGSELVTVTDSNSRDGPSIVLVLTDGGGASSIIPQAMYHYRNNSGSGL